ncbi:hydrogenase nickel incorporation protein HypB [Microbulbifer rhizosphaerae]|uniref:Hydrogenase maturation factor HypB n=1 Tax=Microbulbifer rhizosphaerae TaxID=1562603 RepID=A0A7W4WFT3_9GAMM|nr:hydrogenase nickel incorporation protein HypB [Microbulbifer rhizosphaerae]MBB3063422.1 hydrogenase nickel incorporation protein HypB [Microbulbifer rhizosphaerae]
MCTTCGCSGGARSLLTNTATGKVLSIGEPIAADDGPALHRQHSEHQAGAPDREIDRLHLERDLLAYNRAIAERNRARLRERNIFALNLVSSPGAGKTTLLERTILDLLGTVTISVVEGDQETQFDAERIRATGCHSVQVNTGTGCHLEASMIEGALNELEPPEGSLLMIENVGNLVCPALFDLGEHAKVVVLSVTEGEDKPLKYPHMFRAASLMILNKTDLLPHVDFDLDACIGYARRVNPHIDVLQLSATGGYGLKDWYDWLQGRRLLEPV